jgi:hypothetical protein
MRSPVDTQKVQVLAIGQPTQVLDFTTKTPKLDLSGVPLYKVPVVLSGTGERSDPTTTISVASTAPPSIKSGDLLTVTGLVASTWAFRDNAGRERSGVSFRAERLELVKTNR